ncbi:MAG: low molecular weight phosphotyrosine protein phosphatase [Erysipelotrichaceae bacterium]|nr:low molecular weight phosphotyrosine protein phosphatase [Erysipelotrichaceae bacterium]
MLKICFVCNGNICRSTAAQYIFQDMVNQEGLSEMFYIDSAATSSEETGNPVYPPMKRALEKEGIPIGNHHARQLRKEDYENFDFLIGMDEENMWNMNILFHNDPEKKVHLLMEYTDHPDEIIADPWYTRRFETCVHQLEKGCQGFMKYLNGQGIKPE